MSSAAPLSSRFPPPPVFRQVLERGWAVTALAVGSEPPQGRAHSPPQLGGDGVTPVSLQPLLKERGHRAVGGRGEGTGMGLSHRAPDGAAGQSWPKPSSGGRCPFRLMPPGAASPPTEGVPPGTAGGPPQCALLSTLDSPSLLWRTSWASYGRRAPGPGCELLYLRPGRGQLAGTVPRGCAQPAGELQTHPGKWPSAAGSAAHPRAGPVAASPLLLLRPQHMGAGSVPCPGAS